MDNKVKGWMALLGIFVLVSMIVFWAIKGLMVAPVFVTVLFCSFGAVFSDRWWAGYEAESRAWGLLAAVVTAAAMFAGDSPIAFGRDHPLVGVTLTLCLGYAAYHYDRYQTHQKLKKRSKHMSRVKSAALLDQAQAKSMVSRIQDLTKQLDYRFVAVKPFNHGSILKTEKRIIQCFQALETDELNYVLTNLQLTHIFFVVKDRPSHLHRSSLIRMMAVERLDELGTTARACVLDAIQNMRLTANPESMEWVENIITSTLGMDLTRLKSRVDTKGGIENLHKLLWRDVTDEDVRARIMSHLKEQAEYHSVAYRASPCNSISLTSVASRCSLENMGLDPTSDDDMEVLTLSMDGTSPRPLPRRSSPRASFTDRMSPELTRSVLEAQEEFGGGRHYGGPFPFLQFATNTTSANNGAGPTRRILKILSDVDDTLLSSGGRFPAGIDTKYGRHVLYPGVLTFYKELDIGTGWGCQDGNWPVSRVGNLSFLSARPHVYKDKSEKKSYQKFEALVKARRMHTMPTLLPGSITSGVRMFANDFEPMAAKKFENFDEYATCYPECGFVFVGDNGQGDVWAGEMMKEKWGDAVQAIFIHLVQPIQLTPGFNRPRPKEAASSSSPGANLPPLWERYWHDDPKSRYAKMGIIFFETYVDATVQAARLGLAHPLAVLRVGRAAIAEFSGLGMEREARELRRQELNEDLRKANDYLDTLAEEHPGMERLAYLEAADPRFPIGSTVKTRFGAGKVRHFRRIDAMYEIEMTAWALRGGTVAKVYQPEKDLKWVIKAQPGARVRTPYGPGVVKAIRDTDGMHVVRVRDPLQYHQEAQRSHSQAGDLTAFVAPTQELEEPGVTAYLDCDSVTAVQAIPGDLVKTPYGKGVVEGYRPEDEFYIVIMGWQKPRLPGQSYEEWFGSLPRAYLNTASIFFMPIETSAYRCTIS